MRIAVIPARGGSKRIPRKNIREFAGKPIIAWPIGVALESKLFDKVVVSTDNEEIASIAKGLGALVPFLRRPDLADDYSDTKAVITNAIQELGLPEDMLGDVCCIYPTSVFLTAELLVDGINKLDSTGASFAFAITNLDPVVFRSFTKSVDGRVEMLFPENYLLRTQDLPELFCDAAQFYWGKVEAWQSDRPVISAESIGIFIDSSRVQDIDTEQQWLSAEAKFMKLKQS
jgi:N-acylneuraminate cytidylyltransferase